MLLIFFIYIPLKYLMAFIPFTSNGVPIDPHDG